MCKVKQRSFDTKADYVKRCTLQAIEIKELKSKLKQYETMSCIEFLKRRLGK